MNDSTTSGEGKSGNVKLGAAVVGGYLLGRFKKGRQAMRLAAYLNGGQTPPQALLSAGRQGASSVMANAQAKEIVDQLRGPLLEAIQNIALAQVQSRVTGLSQNLERKTRELGSGAKDKVTDTAHDVGTTATDAVGGVTDAVTGGGKDKDQGEQERPDESEGDKLADAGLDKKDG